MIDYRYKGIAVENLKHLWIIRHVDVQEILMITTYNIVFATNNSMY